MVASMYCYVTVITSVDWRMWLSQLNKRCTSNLGRQ